jgi:hypothetical protein
MSAPGDFEEELAVAILAARRAADGIRDRVGRSVQSLDGAND